MIFLKKKYWDDNILDRLKLTRKICDWGHETMIIL